MDRTILVSTGGKGGTGKSTFAVLLSTKLSKQSKKVVLCDCDVECPNLHLLVDRELKDPEEIYRKIPELDESKCVKCGRCSEVCRENAIFWIEDNYPTFFMDLCSGCGACWIACPNDAIKAKDEIAGETFINKISDNLWLVTGRSKPGISETGPIVGEVKQRAVELAEEVDATHILLDTSPGTHCNVIQALLGSDKAYVVTEPTPLGSHDAGLILELLEIMEVSSNIVLNKAGVGDRKKIEEIASKYGVEIEVEIPYSDELIRAYSRGQLSEVVDLI